MLLSSVGIVAAGTSLTSYLVGYPPWTWILMPLANILAFAAVGTALACRGSERNSTCTAIARRGEAVLLDGLFGLCLIGGLFVGVATAGLAGHEGHPEYAPVLREYPRYTVISHGVRTEVTRERYVAVGVGFAIAGLCGEWAACFASLRMARSLRAPFRGRQRGHPQRQRGEAKGSSFPTTHGLRASS
jgi:hypothetical protein